MGEDAYGCLRYEHADDEAQGGHSGGKSGSLPEHLLYTGILSCTVVVAGDRLHSLVQSHADHDEHEDESVAYSVCSDAEVSAVVSKLLVDEKGHDTCCCVHQEGAHAHHERVSCYLPMQSENTPVEMYGPASVVEVSEHYKHCDCLGYDCRPCGSFYAPAESEYEYRVKYRIEDHGEYRQRHCLLRKAGGPHRGVESEVQVGDDVSVEYDSDIFLRIWKRVFACSEEVQDRVKENQ